MRRHTNRNHPRSLPDGDDDGHGESDATKVVSKRGTEEPIAWEIYNLVQCKSVSLQWTGGLPPYTVTVYTVADNWTSMSDEASFTPWRVLAQNTSSVQTSWIADVPAHTYVSVRVLDGAGRNYTSYPKIVATSSDTSCLPASLQPSATSNANGGDIVYNYRFDNGRLVTSIVLACIIVGVSLIIILVVVCCCRVRTKRRNKKRAEEEAAPRPTYAQFFPHPGAQPVLYVQLTPGSPFVPAGATPEAAAAGPVAAAATATTAIGMQQQAGTQAERQMLLSRAPSPAMSMSGPGAGPVTTGPMVAPNAVASGSGTSTTHDPHSAVESVAAPPATAALPSGRSRTPVGYNPRSNASASSIGTVPSRSG